MHNSCSEAKGAE